MKPFLFLIIVLALCSCKNNEDTVKEVPHDGSVETMITVQHIANSDLDVIVTTNRVWYKNTEKQFIHQDTIPSLGTIKSEVENEDGNTATVTLPKEYEIYITVK